MKTLNRFSLSVLSSIVLGCTLLTPAAFAEDPKKPLPLQEIRQFTDVYGAIKAFYVDPTKDEKLLENALAGMLNGLDPHSAYLDQEAFKDMKEGTQGEFGGLGLEVSMDASGVLVIAPIDDTPAARAGILAGDIIIKIDNQATRTMSLSENVKLMRGKPKTKIELVVARKGVDKPLNFTIVRDLIKVQSVKMKKLKDGYGYIRISQFQEHTANDLAKFLTELEKSNHLKGLVLDLRNDPGGLLTAAVGVVSAFIGKDQTVVSTKGKMSDSDRVFKTIPNDYLNFGQKPETDLIARLPERSKTVPIVVLINAASASASEIVAGALQDHKRATIMGHRSFGKGSVQTILPIRPLDGGEPKTGIKLTTARYFTPSGRTIQAAGITPDIEITDTETGNYLSFDIREADLAGHLTSEAEKETSKKTVNSTAKKEDQQPKERYFFGDDNDFQLQQALRHLKGEKLLEVKSSSKPTKK